jgi:hypothetical protein
MQRNVLAPAEFEVELEASGPTLNGMALMQRMNLLSTKKKTKLRGL